MSWVTAGTAALNLLGIGSAYDAQKHARRAARKDRQQAQAQFDAQMDESVTRRVADARKAGIHPLFALGASSGASPTISAGGSPLPRGITDAVQSTAERMQRAKLSKLTPDESRAMNARSLRDEAEAAFLNSKTATMGQEMASRGRDGAITYPYPMPDQTDVMYGPAEYLNPQVYTSKRKGVESGTHPAMREIMLPDGSKQEIYSPELGLDEIGQVKYVFDRSKKLGRDMLYKVWDAWGRAAGGGTGSRGKSPTVSKRGYREFMEFARKQGIIK